MQDRRVSRAVVSIETASILGMKENCGSSVDARIKSLAEERDSLAAEAIRLKSDFESLSTLNDSLDREPTPFTEDEVESEEAREYIRSCKARIRRAEAETKRLQAEVRLKLRCARPEKKFSCSWG